MLIQAFCSQNKLLPGYTSMRIMSAMKNGSGNFIVIFNASAIVIDDKS